MSILNIHPQLLVNIPEGGQLIWVIGFILVVYFIVRLIVRAIRK
jgi:hypothetical protein